MARDRKAYFAAWHQRNRDRRNAEARAKYRQNPGQKIAATKAYAESHPALRKQIQVNYRARNEEKCRARVRQWRLDNLESQRERERLKSRKFFKENREKVLAQNRAWAKANRDKISARDARRKALKKGATLGDPAVIAHWKTLIRKMKFVRCHWCGTKIGGRKVHFDHVVALANGGAESIENLCASCPECNLSKQDKALNEWMARGQTFLSL